MNVYNKPKIYEVLRQQEREGNLTKDKSKNERNIKKYLNNTNDYSKNTQFKGEEISNT